MNLATGGGIDDTVAYLRW